MFTEWGLGDLLGTFPADNTVEVRVDGEPVFIGRDAHAQEYVGVLTPQQALVRNLIAAFLGDGGDLRFEVADVAMSGLGSQRPIVSYTDGAGTAREIAAFNAIAKNRHIAAPLALQAQAERQPPGWSIRNQCCDCWCCN